MRVSRSAPFALIFTVCIVSAVCIAPCRAQSAQTLAGSWSLVEQKYERGGYNFAAESPFELHFEAAAGALTGRLTWETRAGHFESDWPGYPTGTGPAALVDVHAVVAPDQRTATAAFDVAPSADDDTMLRVTENYVVNDDGRLHVTARVQFVRDGATRGGFTWTRIFERGGR